MLSPEQLHQDFQLLPEEAQTLLADFLEDLKKQYVKSSPESFSPEVNEIRSLDFGKLPFVGLWKDRPELQDSTAWVRQIRQQQWRG